MTHRELRTFVGILPAALILTVASGSARAQQDQGAGGGGGGASAPGALVSIRPFVKAKPIPLDWRKILWPSTDYSRTPVPGGAALYSFPSASAQKFEITFYFGPNVYAFKREERPTLGAAIDLILEGGIGSRTFEELENYESEEGINIGTTISNSTGRFVLQASGLTEDFDKTLALVSDALFSPRFDKQSLDIWKDRRADAFDSLLDAGSIGKQYRFIEEAMMKLAFGEHHYFGSYLERSSKKALQGITWEKIHPIAKKLVSKEGLEVVLAGTYSPEQERALTDVMNRIPRLEPAVRSWLPERSVAAPSKKVRAAIIRKADMTQATIVLRYIYPHLGEMNDIEDTRMDILSEVFSASGGVIGNDRFSKALRADSGISYSPHAYFESELLRPNTNVGAYSLDFQGANPRINEGVNLALKTWRAFIGNGVTQDEMDNARTSRMNHLLAKEKTIFDRSNEVVAQLVIGKTSPSSPTVTDLVSLEQERDLKALNGTLGALAADAEGFLVIMGNPSDKDIAILKGSKDIDLVKVTTFEDFIKPYL